VNGKNFYVDALFFIGMDKAASLDKIKQSILTDLDCPLKDSAKNLVFGKGNPNAKIMFIGEAPGEQEDLQGIPFVGAAGKRLDELLHSIGLTINDCYIANILKYHPPQNRDPAIEEIKRHTPYLIEQIKIIRPIVIATLGNFATKFILARFDVDSMKKVGGITYLHGKPTNLEVDGFSATVIPLYHPAAMLYKPALRDVLAKDFLIIKKVLSEHNVEAPTGEKQTTLI
jgi:DNA polymerase